MKFLRSQRGRLTAGIVLLLALFLVRPGAERLRTRIVRSISLALGRQVDVGSVNIRLLPQPGFDLKNFAVRDDPAFSAEPVLRSAEVTAALRLTSLLRGRLEIARLSLTEPSLNLVRNTEGHWNLENLLERAAKTPVAPTSKAKTEIRPGFPYIEADGGRINFKFGPEKKPCALTEAGFALAEGGEPARNPFAVQPAVGSRTTRASHQVGLRQGQGLAGSCQGFCHIDGYAGRPHRGKQHFRAGFSPL